MREAQKMPWMLLRAALLGVYANHPATVIKQRAATVARVDRRIVLDDVKWLIASANPGFAVEVAQHATVNGGLKSPIGSIVGRARIAHGNDRVSLVRLFACQFHHRQAQVIDLEQRQIEFG